MNRNGKKTANPQRPKSQGIQIAEFDKAFGLRQEDEQNPFLKNWLAANHAASEAQKPMLRLEADHSSVPFRFIL